MFMDGNTARIIEMIEAQMQALVKDFKLSLITLTGNPWFGWNNNALFISITTLERQKLSWLV
jgi:hypothetical protein